MSDVVKYAAVSMVKGSDGRYLCVWNRRYNGWAFPGGLVEQGETAEQAQQRELLEEAGLYTLSRTLVYDGPTQLVHDVTRAGHVKVYDVKPAPGVPAAGEDGCPIAWLTRDEFLQSTPFASLYREKIFPLLDKQCPTAPRSAEAVDHPKHYNDHPSAVECIDIVEHMPFNIGNAIKYLWRAGIKATPTLEDLEKARWYVEREIRRLKRPAVVITPEIRQRVRDMIYTLGDDARSLGGAGGCMHISRTFGGKECLLCGAKLEQA